jgi:hypothetical protein
MLPSDAVIDRILSELRMRTHFELALYQLLVGAGYRAEGLSKVSIT